MEIQSQITLKFLENQLQIGFDQFRQITMSHRMNLTEITQRAPCLLVVTDAILRKLCFSPTNLAKTHVLIYILNQYLSIFKVLTHTMYLLTCLNFSMLRISPKTVLSRDFLYVFLIDISK